MITNLSRGTETNSVMKTYMLCYIIKSKGNMPYIREEEMQMSVRQTNKKNKHEQAYSIIRERIFNGTYVPGYRLVIDGLARELGISPVPIREAIRRLEAEGQEQRRSRREFDGHFCPGRAVERERACHGRQQRLQRVRWQRVR